MSEEITTTTYVALLYHRISFTGETIAPGTVRNPRKLVKDIPSDVYAFYYFDIVRTFVDVDGEEVECASERLNRSKRYYIDAQVLDYDAVENLPGDNRIVLGYMEFESEKYGYVLRCRTGNFVPYDPGNDVLLSSR